MRTIEDVLDAATPPAASPPTAKELRAAMGDRTRRRRNFVVVVATIVAALGVLGVVTGLGDGERVESANADTDADADELINDVVGATTTQSSRTESSIETRPWEIRWFLVPPEPAELRRLSSQDTIDTVTVTTDPTSPSTAALAKIYHVAGADIYRIGDPNWSYHSVTVEGRAARVGTDPNSDRMNVFLAADTGVFVVGGVGLNEDQATDLALAARLVDGAAVLGDRVPVGFSVASPPRPTPTDHTTTLGWGPPDSSLSLQMSPATIEDMVLVFRSTSAEPTTVRGAPGVYVPEVEDQTPGTIVWVEDSYVITLSLDGDQTLVDAEQLVAIANSLQRIDQPALVDRFDDPFMRRQAATVQEWLTSTPPPEGWDLSPLINSVPHGELGMAQLVRGYLECTWLAEWGDAVRVDDQQRRSTAEATLANRADWPVFVAQMRVLEDLTDRSDDGATSEDDGFAAQAELMASIQTPDQLQDFEADYGCGFVTPSG